jgi:hypothetical protein
MDHCDDYQSGVEMVRGLSDLDHQPSTACATSTSIIFAPVSARATPAPTIAPASRARSWRSRATDCLPSCNHHYRLRRLPVGELLNIDYPNIDAAACTIAENFDLVARR